MHLFENPVLCLCAMKDGEEGDFFALLCGKEELTTRDGKPYFRVTFRDAQREVAFPIWNDAPWCKPCREEWKTGEFYKLRALFRETNFGPQLEIRKIRAIQESDSVDGFDPLNFMPRSRFDPKEMLAELESIVKEQITNEPLQTLVLKILNDNREQLLLYPAARRNHHAFAGGFLEHVRNVTRTCVYLANSYAVAYPDLNPPLDKGLVVAGAILHDIGKLRELRPLPSGTEYTASGSLIGHVLQGRDILLEFARDSDIDTETLLRLEHIIVAHQRLPEWGAPKAPMTPEAMLVHFADDIDAKYQMMVDVYAADTSTGSFTARRNILNTQLYRGGE